MPVAMPGVPTLLKPGSLTAALGNLEGAKSNGNNGADQSAEKSGFSSKNSGQPAHRTGRQSEPATQYQQQHPDESQRSTTQGQRKSGRQCALENQPKRTRSTDTAKPAEKARSHAPDAASAER